MTILVAQILAHEVDVVRHRNFAPVGTGIFIIAVAMLFAWIFALQWIAMSRLAKQA